MGGTASVSFFERVGERLNPILIKELRQALHSREIQGLTALLAVVQLLMLYLQCSGKEHDGFVFFCSVLCCFGVGIFGLATIGSWRFSSERQAEALDLMFITTLTPRQLIGGKFGALVVVELQLYAVTLPFMIISFYLCNVEMVWIFQYSSLIFFGGWALFLLGLLFGACSRPLVAVCAMGSILFLGPMLTGIVLTSLDLLSMTELFSWLLPTASILVVAAACFMLAVSAVANPGSNRIRPVRIGLLVLVLVICPLFGYVLMLHTGDGFIPVDFYGSWFRAAMLAATGAMVLAALEPALPSRRIVAELPDSKLRLPALLFSGSAVAGILFAAIIASVAAALQLAFGGWAESQWRITGLVGYVAGFAGLSIALCRYFKTRLPRNGAGICFTVVLFLFGLIPFLILTALDSPVLEGHRGSAYTLLTPWALLARDCKSAALAGFGWAAFFSLVNLPLFFQWLQVVKKQKK